VNSSPEAGLIIQEATAAQLRAADPSASVLVNASAGTGKTKVLTDRILSLLLQGSTPDKILALTFTKAAAGEMLNRLLGRLSKWATCEQADLHKEIYALIQRDPDQDQMDRAQSLFARVLDTPGGLKIQTIHAFCQSLLARFPLEANLPPNFQLIEDRTVEELLREARERTLFRAKSNPGSALTLALLKLSAQMQDQKFSDIMSKVASSRHRIEGFLTSYGGLTGAAAALRSSLGVANLVSSQSVANELLNAEFLTKLQSFADLLATSKTAMSSN
jgi:ATP-dependent helicase/nuclease subunit A